MSRRKKLLFGTILFTGIFLLGLGTLELVARSCGYQAAPEIYHRTLWIPDSELGWQCKADGQFSYLGSRGWLRGSTDKNGFRPVLSCREDQKSPVILCLGDSTTFSAEVLDEETWPEAASRALATAGLPCRMVNRGIGGYSAVQSLLVLRRTLKDPDLANDIRGVVYHFCANDPAENFLPDRPHFEKTSVLSMPGDSRKDAFRLIPPKGWDGGRSLSIKRVKQRVLANFATYSMIRSWSNDTGPASFKVGAGNAFKVTLEGYSGFLAQAHLREGMRYSLGELQKECEMRKIPLFVTSCNYAPWDADGAERREFSELTGIAVDDLRRQAETYHAACELLRRTAEEAGAVYIDLRGCLSGMSYREYAASPMDWHFSAAANERIGQAIARKLRPFLQPSR
jgi:lysophospholipase L1-like esterase